MAGVKGMKRLPKYNDEFTNREDLTESQKYRLRHPDRYKQIKLKSNEVQRKRWNNLTQSERRSLWLKRKYNLSYVEYEELYHLQNGKCKICSIEISIKAKDNGHETACVDHCHSTNTIRGLLCNHCNRALGLLKENPSVIENLLNYIRSFNESNSPCPS